MNDALAHAARGQHNGAVGAVMPLAVSISEAGALIESVLVLHRHGRRDTEVPSLFQA